MGGDGDQSMLQSSVARIQQGCSPIGCCGVGSPGQGLGETGLELGAERDMAL